MSQKARFKHSPKGNFIGGRFSAPVDPNGEWVVRCPGDFSDELGKVTYSYQSIEQAVDAARRAFDTWRRTPLSARAEILKKYQEELKRRGDELVETIAREVGKPLWEAKTELTAMVNKVDVTINESMKFVADFDIANVLPGTLGLCRHKPLGVMVVVGPFNFPGHLPNGHIVPALLTGNTVIFKPSEKAPLTAQLMAECLDAAGIPAGAFNLVQGEREVSRRLCLHEGVDGILFAGSYEVGTRLKQDTLQQHWKMLALEMGGKNATLVWDDADLDVAIQETLVSAFITAGQRCSATSRVIVHSRILDEFLQKFHAKAKAFTIGHPLDNPFMGPLVEQGAVDRYMKFVGMAQREGCEIIMRGKALDLPYKGNYVTPSICWVKESSIEAARKSVYQQTEIFGPNVAIIGSDDIDHAIGLANATQFGLVASVFTASRETYKRCFEDLETGLVNWNRSTIGASSRLPFGGLKKSGNHRPTALLATQYCAVPVSVLEVEKPELAKPGTYPGLEPS